MHMQHAHAMDMDMNMRMQHAHVPLSRTWCHTATFCVLSREFADISAVDAAIAGGARTFAVLGIGSLLPALHAASRGANVAVVEACEPLAQIARTAASANCLDKSLVVVSSYEFLFSAWGKVRTPKPWLAENGTRCRLASRFGSHCCFD